MLSRSGARVGPARGAHSWHASPYLTLLQAKCAKVKAIAAQVAKREAAAAAAAAPDAAADSAPSA